MVIDEAKKYDSILLSTTKLHWLPVTSPTQDCNANVQDTPFWRTALPCATYRPQISAPNTRFTKTNIYHRRFSRADGTAFYRTFYCPLAALHITLSQSKWKAHHFSLAITSDRWTKSCQRFTASLRDVLDWLPV